MSNLSESFSRMTAGARPLTEPNPMKSQSDRQRATNVEIGRIHQIFDAEISRVQRPEEFVQLVDRFMRSNSYSSEAKQNFLDNVVTQVEAYYQARAGSVRPRQMPETPLVPNFHTQYLDTVRTMVSDLRTRYQPAESASDRSAA